MKKRIILSLTFLLCLFMFCNYYTVQASSISDYETITEEMKAIIEEDVDVNEQKIMKYDVKTKTTTEVNMDELRQRLENNSSRSYNKTSTSSYIPNSISRNNILNPYSTRTSYYTQITNTSVYPHTTISKITSSGGSGSGTIIGRNVAITVAHVVIDGDCNVYDDLTIMPGYSGGLLGDDFVAGWSTIYYTPDWASDKGAHNDWAIIVLDRNIGDTTGWCGIQYHDTSSELLGKTGYALGYPGGESLGYTEYQWMTSGNISFLNTGSFGLDTLFVGGISGGPVYLNVNDAMIVGMCTAVYTSPGEDVSLCTRITQNMVDIVNGL